MICPHCQIGTSPFFVESTLGKDDQRQVHMEVGNCTECQRLIVRATAFEWTTTGSSAVKTGIEELMFFPSRVPPRPISAEVESQYADDFREACIVVGDSPKASAALSRRLLQHIIREKAGIRKANLNDEIDALVESDALPSDLAHDLDMIRTVGNFAAHPIKSTNTGDVVQVEPGEAEALLDLNEELLDYYFVRPARRQAKRDALNAKLKDAGKPELKGT